MSKESIKLSYYSISKDEHIDIEDMAHEHLVNVLNKLVKDPDYLANFVIRIDTGDGDYVTDTATLKFTDMSRHRFRG